MIEILEVLSALALFRAIAQDVIFATLLAGSLAFGQGPERACSLTWLVAVYFWPEMAPAFGLAPREPVDLLAGSAVFLIIDAGLFAGFALVAITANRLYVLVAAAFQLIALIAIVLKALMVSLNPVAFVVLNVGSTWLALLTLVIGLVNHIRRQQAGLKYPDWRGQVHRPRTLAA